MLGCARNADDKTIKKAYRKAAMKYHPDRQSNKSEAEKKKAEALFKSINEGYEILSDPKKRRMYDSGMDAQEIDQGGPMHGHGAWCLHAYVLPATLATYPFDAFLTLHTIQRNRYGSHHNATQEEEERVA